MTRPYRLAVVAAVFALGIGAASALTAASSDPQTLTPGTYVVPPPATVTQTVMVTSTGPATVTANAWVNTAAGASPARCATACAYDPAKAYGSLGAARAVASCGDLILVKAGSFGAQTTSTVAGSCGANVTIQREPGATVTLASLNVQSSYTTVGDLTSSGAVTVANPNTAQTCTSAGALTNVTLAGDSGAYVEVLGAVSNTLVSGGSYGGTNDGSHSRVGTFTGSDTNDVPCHTTFDGVLIHDVQAPACTACVHTECFQVSAGVPVDLVIVNSTFIRCPQDVNGSVGNVTAAVSIGAADGLTLRNVDMFYGDGGLKLGQNIRNATIEYDSIRGTLGFFTGSCTAFASCWGAGSVIRANIIEGKYYGTCPANSGISVPWGHNLYAVEDGNGACASTDTALPSGSSIGWVDRFANLSLTSTSPARGAGDPASCPATDITGAVRPQGGTVCDAGAHEVA